MPECCPDCAAAVHPDQRYCLACGRRVRDARLDWHAVVGRVAAAVQAEGPIVAVRGVALPTPRVAAALLLIVMGFGVVVAGAATSGVPRALAAAPRGTVTVVLPPVARAPAAAPAPVATPAATPAPAVAPTPAPAPAVSTPAPPTPPAPTHHAPSHTPAPAPKTPPIKHVFVLSLGAGSFDAWFGDASPVPYLARDLAARGTLLSAYRATSSGELANEIALLSGQPANPQTDANCPTYSPVAPGTVGADGRAAGEGCVYSQEVYTLPDQLTAAGLTWKAYIEGQDAPGADPAACRHPADGAPDPFAAPREGDPYVTWRNPFVYFQTITSTPDCATDDGGLSPLPADLATRATTPSLSWIAPSPLSDTPSSADAWLRMVVPGILASKAYADGGLLAIVPDASGDPTDPTTGALLLSRYVAPGAVNTTAYDHLALLKSIEDLFGLRHLAGAQDRSVKAFGPSVYTRFTASSPRRYQRFTTAPPADPTLRP